MTKIQSLPREVYERIKAGEVVEDPASVVRELLDNSLDSGATSVSVEIQEGGIAGIQVRDNGCGMSPEDLELCYLPHTTSKITRFEDIFSLSTSGFRGEALSSIARVSQMKILSSSGNTGEGMALYLEGGRLLKQAPEARERGTTLWVQELFYNVPVRRGFVSSPVKETRKIREEILNKALAHPEVEFSLESGKNRLEYFPAASFEERIRQVFEDSPSALIPFHYQNSGVSIRGAVSDLQHTYSNSTRLYFFINNRYVKPRFLYAAVNSVFGNLIPRGRYPQGVFYLYLQPGQIDPNIHPSKKEIRVFNENQVFYHLTQALKQAFGLSASEKRSQESLNTFSPSVNAADGPFEKKDFQAKSNQEILLDFGDKTVPVSANLSSMSPYHYLGILFQTYLLAEKDQELWIIDFHAAHERFRYEELKSRPETGQKEDLLSPRILNLSQKELLSLSENRQKLLDLGFSFYLFGEDAVVVTGVPAFYQEKNWEEDFKDLLIRHPEDENLSASRDRILKSVACRGSYMSGDRIHSSEAERVLELVFSGKIPSTCPHGRPLAHRISKKQMAGFFLRNPSE